MQRKNLPLKDDIYAIVCQESRGFSHERFKLRCRYYLFKLNILFHNVRQRNIVLYEHYRTHCLLQTLIEKIWRAPAIVENFKIWRFTTVKCEQ